MILWGRSIRIGLSGLALVGMIMSSNFAAANDDDLGPVKDTLSVGVTAGVFLPDSDVHDFYYQTNDWQPLSAAGPAMGLRVSYEPFPYAGIELEGEAIPMGTATTDDSVTMWGWRAQIVGQLPGRFTPFVLLGGGQMGIISADSVLGDEADLNHHFGAGAKFFITSQLLVRLDGRWLIAPKLDDPNNPGADDDSASHFLITSSLSWRFGGSQRRIPPADLDPDHDGVIGARDKCKFEPGVKPDGCPAVADRDHDAIPDRFDVCPDEAEVVNGVDDKDGCPDKEPDKDKDGFADRLDTCPDAAEDVDGFQDTDGCPDPDNDNDGIADAKDGCALAAGPAENRGCPDKDSDNDGLVDRFDNCPGEPGMAENYGCRSKQLVVIAQNEIKILDKVYFGSKNAVIRARSNPLLDNLAQILNAHPEITRVTVEGHTDDHGDAGYNKDLSQRRARAVLDYLAGRGVSASRLEAIGRGEENPVADNRTQRGRAENRRVEFRIERNPVAASL